MPEVEVGADDHEARAEQTDEHLVHEVLGRLLAAPLVEPQHAHDVEQPCADEQLELVVERGQQGRRRLGSHDLRRMAVERDADRVEVAGVGELAHELEHLAWPRCTPSYAPIVTTLPSETTGVSSLDAYDPGVDHRLLSSCSCGAGRTGPAALELRLRCGRITASLGQSPPPSGAASTGSTTLGLEPARHAARRPRGGGPVPSTTAYGPSPVISNGASANTRPWATSVATSAPTPTRSMPRIASAGASTCGQRVGCQRVQRGAPRRA